MRVECQVSAFLLLLAVCQANDKPTAAVPATVQVRDYLGRSRRVLALAPSMTKILYAVANTSTVIARTQANNYPAAALRKPVVTSCPLEIAPAAPAANAG